jgi:hypothetical protein
MSQHRERRFSVRAAVDIAVTWYSLGRDGRARGHDGIVADLSATGASLSTATAPVEGALIALALRDDDLNADLAARVVRVTRAAGGWRAGVQFVNVTPEQRLALTRKVLRKRAA